MSTELLAAELGVLMGTDRRLTASEERRRSWLVRELAERDKARAAVIAAQQAAAGIDEVRALRELLVAKRDPNY